MDLHSAGFTFGALQSFYMLQPLFPGLCPLHQLFRIMLLHAAYHFFLTGDFPLLVIVGSQLRLPALAFLGGKGGVIALVAIDLVVFHLKNPADRPVKKIPVVGYDHNGSFICGKVLLKPLQGSYVQMVCRLVQKEQVGLFQQQSRQCKSGTLAS